MLACFQNSRKRFSRWKIILLCFLSNLFIHWVSIDFFEQFSHTSAWQGLSFSILFLRTCLSIFRNLRVAPCLGSVSLDDWLGVGIGASSAHCKTLALKIIKNINWSCWTVSPLFKAINILWRRCCKNEVNKWKWRKNRLENHISDFDSVMASDDRAEWRKWVISSSRPLPLHSLPFLIDSAW